MDNENELQQLTVRLPLNIKEKIESLAKSGNCSTAEIVRRAVDGNLNKYLSGVQYVDKEQGEAIKKAILNACTELSGIKTELHRIGVNYNQEVRLKNLGNKYSSSPVDVKELLNERDSIVKECKGFSPEVINEIMKRFDTTAEEFINNMAYTRISHTKNGRAAIQYARGDGKGHNGHERRNLLIGCVGMLPDEVIPIEEQMAEDWQQASKNNLNQIRRIVASFSENELAPQGEDSAYIALEIAQEFVEEAYPNRKAAIFIQNDGKGGKLHVHILVSNVDSIEHKGCTDEQTNFRYVENHFDRVAGRHIKLDYGKKAEEKYLQNERRLQEENEEAADNGSAAEYVWKDDLRERVRIAMENADSESDFLEALEDEGVKARYGTSKRYGEYITYELVDVPDHMADTGKKYKARSYTLGAAYGPDALRDKLREKAGERLRTAEQQNNTAEAQNNLARYPQANEGNAKTAAQDLTNRAPERKSVDSQTVRNMINAVIDENPRTETPTPAQPTNGATTPPTAAEGTDSTPTQKQPVQGQTAPQKGKLDGMAKLREMLKRDDAEKLRRGLENQHNGMDWGLWK